MVDVKQLTRSENENKTTHPERKQEESQLAFLAEISADFASLVSADEIMQCVGEKLAQHLNLSRCDFSVVEEEANRITTVYDWRRDVATPSVLGEHQISTFLTPAARQLYVAGKLAVINDVRNHPLISAPAEMMAALHIGAVVDAPYLENGRWKFLISACRAAATDWRADEIELIRELAARIYIRLERAHAEEGLRQSEEKYRTLFNSITQVFALSSCSITKPVKRWIGFISKQIQPSSTKVDWARRAKN